MGRVRTIEGKHDGRGVRAAIVVSKFNDFISKRLLDGCLQELARLGVRSQDSCVVWVPGAYEIPVVAARLASRKTIQVVICLGAVIRGETKHFDLVAQGVAEGIMRVSIISGKPVVFGVLAVDTVEQAYQRSEENGAHKGKEAAVTAIEMVSVLKQIKEFKG